MADRLAQSGYAVLTVNQFYRSTKAPLVTQGEGMTPAFQHKVGPWRALLTPEATTRDATAFVAFLDKQPEVATTRTQRRSWCAVPARPPAASGPFGN